MIADHIFGKKKAGLIGDLDKITFIYLDNRFYKIKNLKNTGSFQKYWIVRTKDFTCPLCGSKFHFRTGIDNNDYFTTECNHCESLLLYDHGTIYDFHKRIHEKDNRWLKDGKGTGFIEF